MAQNIKRRKGNKKYRKRGALIIMDGAEYKRRKRNKKCRKGEVLIIIMDRAE